MPNNDEQAPVRCKHCNGMSTIISQGRLTKVMCDNSECKSNSLVIFGCDDLKPSQCTNEAVRLWNFCMDSPS